MTITVTERKSLVEYWHGKGWSDEQVKTLLHEEFALEGTRGISQGQLPDVMEALSKGPPQAAEVPAA